MSRVGNASVPPASAGEHRPEPPAPGGEAEHRPGPAPGGEGRPRPGPAPGGEGKPRSGLAAVVEPLRGPWTRVAGAAAAALFLAWGSTLATGSSWIGLLFVIGGVGLVGIEARRREAAHGRALRDALDAVARGEPPAADADLPAELRFWLDRGADLWSEAQAGRERARALADAVSALPAEMDQLFDAIERSTTSQEAAVEETASYVADMRTSMRSIEEQVEQLLRATEESAASSLQLGGSIEEVARSSAALQEVVDASTSSVHEMGASIRQVASSADHVHQMADDTAAAVTQMDRSIQQVSTHAREAASRTQAAVDGAEMGGEAVRATIEDIEKISALTTQAKERLTELVRRVSKIGQVLEAIDEINDETNLLSLNAAIIAAQAGERGKPFLVVANHVKTLARRTSASTQDIERLIADIETESGGAVQAMEAGIAAVEAGVKRSRSAGEALESIRDACREASECVDEIARSTAEQSNSSKGVAEATQRTSAHIQQISEAMAEQRRASEQVLSGAERAGETCQQVHRSTEEQRSTSHHIAEAITGIRDMVRVIGEQTASHTRASDELTESILSLLENAKQSGTSVEPLRASLQALELQAAAMLQDDGNAATGENGAVES